MSNTLTIRLPDDLAKWLEETSRKSGIPRGRIVKMELERAQKDNKRPFMRHAGVIDGPPDLSSRKGFARK
jgi:predicted transcriptional regulator